MIYKILEPENKDHNIKLGIENTKYNIYCDESCHLPYDGYQSMALGYIKIDNSEANFYKNEIKNILQKNFIDEIKWNKISKSRLDIYKKLVELFFKSNMHFRSIIVDKKQLDHKKFNNNDPDIFYYKTLFSLLYNQDNQKINQNYKVFLDWKDHWGKVKIKKLKEYINLKLPSSSPFISFQYLHSHDSVFIQLVDLFIGAINYYRRFTKKEIENMTSVKEEFINYLKNISGNDFIDSTPPWEDKFNIFYMQPGYRRI